MATYTREEIKTRSFELRQQLHCLKEEYNAKKAAILEELGPKPWFFSVNKRKAWEYLKTKKMAELIEWYVSDPVVKELKELVENCPHEFTPWGPTDMGMEVVEAFQSRQCCLCGETETYIDDECGFF